MVPAVQPLIMGMEFAAIFAAKRGKKEIKRQLGKVGKYTWPKGGGIN